jgi:hypothetical protein
VTAETLRTFWTVGDLQCVLVKHPHGPQRYTVQVINGPEVVCSAFVDEPIEIEALAAAERLKVIFVDRAR